MKKDCPNCRKIPPPLQPPSQPKSLLFSPLPFPTKVKLSKVTFFSFFLFSLTQKPPPDSASSKHRQVYMVGLWQPHRRRHGPDPAPGPMHLRAQDRRPRRKRLPSQAGRRSRPRPRLGKSRRRRQPAPAQQGRPGTTSVGGLFFESRD